MIDFTILEDAITEQLKTELAAIGYECTAMPETEKEQEKPPVKNGRVVVAYKGSIYGAATGANSNRALSRATFGVSQTETMEFVLVISCRRTRGAGGVAQAKNAIVKALLGWHPPECSEMLCKDFLFESRSENVWKFTQAWETTTLVVEYDREIVGPAITQITNNVTVSNG